MCEYERHTHTTTIVLIDSCFAFVGWMCVVYSIGWKATDTPRLWKKIFDSVAHIGTHSGVFVFILTVLISHTASPRHIFLILPDIRCVYVVLLGSATNLKFSGEQQFVLFIDSFLSFHNLLIDFGKFQPNKFARKFSKYGSILKLILSNQLIKFKHT